MQFRRGREESPSFTVPYRRPFFSFFLDLFKIQHTPILNLIFVLPFPSHPHTGSINMKSKVDKDFHLSDLSILIPAEVQQRDNILTVILISPVAQDTTDMVIEIFGAAKYSVWTVECSGLSGFLAGYTT